MIICEKAVSFRGTAFFITSILQNKAITVNCSHEPMGLMFYCMPYGVIGQGCVWLSILNADMAKLRTCLLLWKRPFPF